MDHQVEPTENSRIMQDFPRISPFFWNTKPFLTSFPPSLPSAMPRVELAVYDLSNGLASQMSQAILGQRIDGIWHTGVLVYGYEYFFGGGIQKLPIGQFTSTNGLHPVQILHLGDTTIPQHLFEQYLSTLRSRYTQETYDLIHHNCNNFADEISKHLLGGAGIPSHIVDLPRIVFSTPGGVLLPPSPSPLPFSGTNVPLGIP